MHVSQATKRHLKKRKLHPFCTSIVNRVSSYRECLLLLFTSLLNNTEVSHASLLHSAGRTKFYSSSVQA